MAKLKKEFIVLEDKTEDIEYVLYDCDGNVVGIFTDIDEAIAAFKAEEAKELKISSVYGA